ncbi:MAG: uracil-DNA glycosylase [Planctomycetaceae bacterium]|jgi:uracil-DNA glycosylase family 4|nr:uracil-DNA glycosylase [Planctomycetaceae bacterium]
MPYRIRDGLIDYLEIMQIAGVSELGPPVIKDRVSAETETVLTETGDNSTTEIVENQTKINETPDKNLENIEPNIDIENNINIEPNINTENNINIQNIEQIPKEKTETIIQEPLISMSKSKTELLQELAQKVAQCTRCSELTLTRTQTVFGSGNPDAKLVFLGEAPGADEDKQGKPFVGRAGMLLTDIITKGMKIQREDVYICNILRCRPPNNRPPFPDEAELCKPFLEQTLEIIEPKFICCLGAVAAQNLLQMTNTIGSMRGKIYRYKNIKVVCTYHPAYLLRNPAMKKQTWEDIQFLMREMGLTVS